MVSHLSFAERRIIAGLLHRKVSVAQIAVQLGRHRSTIHREIRRNFWHDLDVPMADGYWHMNAQQLASTRRCRQRKLVRHDVLRLAVIDRLREGWSPEQIAGRLRHEGHRQRVCHETIYSYVYSPDGQSQDLARYLPERRRKRKARFARKPRSLVFPERCMVPKREVFGHWGETGPSRQMARRKRVERSDDLPARTWPGQCRHRGRAGQQLTRSCSATTIAAPSRS